MNDSDSQSNDETTSDTPAGGGTNASVYNDAERRAQIHETRGIVQRLLFDTQRPNLPAIHAQMFPESSDGMLINIVVSSIKQPPVPVATLSAVIGSREDAEAYALRPIYEPQILADERAMVCALANMLVNRSLLGGRIYDDEDPVAVAELKAIASDPDADTKYRAWWMDRTAHILQGAAMQADALLREEILSSMSRMRSLPMDSLEALARRGGEPARVRRAAPHALKPAPQPPAAPGEMRPPIMLADARKARAERAEKASVLRESTFRSVSAPPLPPDENSDVN